MSRINDEPVVDVGPCIPDLWEWVLRLFEQFVV